MAAHWIMKTDKRHPARHLIISIVLFMVGLTFLVIGTAIGLTNSHLLWRVLNSLAGEFIASWHKPGNDQVVAQILKFSSWVIIFGWFAISFVAIKKRRIPGLITALMIFGIAGGYVINNGAAYVGMDNVSPYLIATTGLYFAASFLSFHLSRNIIMSLGVEILGLVGIFGACLIVMYSGQGQLSTVISSVCLSIGWLGVMLAVAKAWWVRKTRFSFS